MLALNQRRNDALSMATKAAGFGSCYNPTAFTPDLVRHGLVDLTGAEARVDEFIDEGFDLAAPVT